MNIVSTLLGYNRQLNISIFEQSLRRVNLGTDCSMYATKVAGRSNQAIISPSCMEAFIAYIEQKTVKTGKGGFGKRNFTYVAELPSGKEDGNFYLATYLPTEGTLQASIYSPDELTVSTYMLGEADGPSGEVLLLAMMQEFLNDEEFSETFDEFEAAFIAGFPDKDRAYHLAGKLCQNLYYRMSDDSVAAHIEYKIQSSGKLPLIKGDAIEKNIYAPDTIFSGEFQILGSAVAGTKTTTRRRKVGYSLDDLVGKFDPNPSRVMTADEVAMVPVMSTSYIIPEFVMDICKTIQGSAYSSYPMMNFTLRGGAGSGKSEGTRAIAAGLNKPHVFYTCSADTEVFDFIGQVMPASKNNNPEAMKLLAKFEKLGGINSRNIAKVYNLPSLEDAEFMPEEVYSELTGKTFTDDMDEAEKLSAVYRAWHETMERKFDEVAEIVSMDKDNKFVYTETNFIKAIKNGWVVEIQEPNVIASPGVLVGLNGLLEEGSISLPTGEVITRHPDTVVIFTTNVSYQGCRAMNQSVIDRSNELYDVDTPSTDIMVQRVMAITEFPDEEVVTEMANIVKDISVKMAAEGIEDGACGMRSLISWAMKTKLTGDPYKAAMTTVLSKCSNDKDARDVLLMRLDESSFKPSKRTRKR